MASLVGQRIGKYQIEGLIGRGGMGIVYRAVDLALQRPVALKLFQAAGGPDLMTRFRREAQIMAALEHPHIVPIYEIGEWQEQPFIVMRLVEGRSLAQIIAQEGPLPLARVAHIATQVASALDYAHSRGVVHRDVKPSNVLVTSGDQAILTDFGIARAQGWGSLTQTGMVMGSPEYMSPEQITGHSVGPAADIYALGCVVYQLLTGHAPFERDTPSAVLYAHEHHPPQPLRQVNPRVPSAVEGIVLQALAKDPARRYRSAGEFAAALQAMLEPPTMVGMPVRRKNRKGSPVAFVAVLAVAGLVLVVSALAVANQQPTPTATSNVAAIRTNVPASQTPLDAARTALAPLPTITPPAPTPRPTRPCRQGDLGRIVDRGQIFIYVYRERRQLSGLMGCELGVGDQVTIMGGRERGEQTYGSIFWLPVHYVTQKGQICEGWVPEPLVECTQDIIISTATPLPPTSTNTSVPRPTFTLTPRLPAPTPSPTPLAAPSITSPPPDFRASSRLEILWDWEPALKENWRYDVRFFWAGEADPFYTELRKERRAEIKVDEWKPGEVFITVRVVEVDDEGEYKGVDVSRESEPVRVQVVRPQPEPPAPTPTPLRGDISAWNETTALPEAFGHSPAVIFGNAIYMAGGEGPPGYFRTKVYYAPIQPDGTIGNWRETSPLPNPVHYHATTVANGHLYVLGGVRNGSPSKDVYRAKINSDGTLAPWSISTALPVALVAPAAVTSGNKIYVLGGHSGISNEKSVYYASSRSNGDLSDWNFTEPLPEPLSWLSAVVQGKRVYAVAGASFDRVTSWSRGVYYADIDPEGRLAPWHAATPLPKAMGNHVALISKGFLYVVGGLSGKSQAWSFYAPVNKDGSIGAWSETRPIPQPIHDHSAVVWHDRIYVLGGFSDDARRYQNKVYLTSP